MTKPCFAHGCQTLVDRDRLMCEYHWELVPPEIQRAVNFSYRQWLNAGPLRPYRMVRLEAKLAVAYVLGSSLEIVEDIRDAIRKLEAETR